MQRTKREVEASLRQKGFQAEEIHHSMFTYYTSEGLRSTVRTSRCKLDQAAYEKHLTETGDL